MVPNSNTVIASNSNTVIVSISRLLGKPFTGEKMELKTWEVTIKATLVSVGNIDTTGISEVLAKELCAQAGNHGYIVVSTETLAKEN